MDCIVCGGSKLFDAQACTRCQRILDRIESKRLQNGIVRRSDKQARMDALAASWDAEGGCFRCHYTGVPLDEDDHRKDRSLSWELRVPNEQSSVVVTSALVSRMKTDLSDEEFQRMVSALHSHFTGGTFDEDAYPDRGAPAPAPPAQIREPAFGQVHLRAS